MYIVYYTSFLSLPYILGGEHSSAFAQSVKAHVSALVREGQRTVPVAYSQAVADSEETAEKKVV